MKIAELLAELKTLKLPQDKFAITSSGPLGVRNLREINDLDIIVYPEVWRELIKNHPVTKENNFESIYIGNLQILGKGSWFTDNQFGSIESQIDDADEIDGFKYVQLSTILAIKQLKTREKDIQDVKLIKDYLTTL